MDLLKDITRELRGSEESTRDEGSAGRAPRGDVADEPTTDSPGEFPAGDDSPVAPRADSLSADTHVCSFCETEFDADRRTCPECDAELVLRGER